jgi:hypothetical protein
MLGVLLCASALQNEYSRPIKKPRQR